MVNKRKFWRFLVNLCEGIREWLSDRENLFFMVLILVHLLPIWLFKYFPSQDGPAHLYNSNVLRQYYFPERSLFREYYFINQQLAPNWFIHLVMAGLMYVVPPLVAEKLLLSSYVILLPISIRYALHAIRPDAKFLAFLAFPFIYNRMLHMGFYNFSFSLPMFFFVVGYWLKYQNQFTLRNTVTLGFLALLLYFCHLVSLVPACVAIAVLTVWLTLFEVAQQLRQQEFDPQSLWKAFRRRALMPLCAFLPTLIIAAMFTLSKESAAEHNIFQVPIWKQALKLLSLNSIGSYHRLEVLLSTALAGLFVAIFIYLMISKVAHRQINRWDGLLLLVATYVVIYFIAPNAMYGGGHLIPINVRLIFYPFFALILWFGAQSYQRLMKRRIQIIAVGISLMLLGIHTVKYAELNNYMEEYVSGMNLIEPNTTLLTHHLDSLDKRGRAPNGQVVSWRIEPFENFSAYVAAQRHLVDLRNYAAGRDYFPIMFRSSLNPYIHINTDDITYSQETGGRVDYVLVWGLHKEDRENEETKSIFRQLQDGYELIYTSPQRGLKQLYRRKDWKQ
ncbi:hypothetical protein [Chroococcidiopsis sp. CCMEE 29]|uniref:hypothetical protein n=1 Tax=Chroococcidiopsis sp. CCMEE 29 TaxID=155894 RepID=UPI002020C69C|nr:hypothetical protein [Chroococcidiopsis sp. CCMEE 29]